VLVENSSQAGAEIVGEQVLKQMVAEQRDAHVVARSGSSESDATKAACWSRDKGKWSDRYPASIP
jgi:hypothetical protein